MSYCIKCGALNLDDISICCACGYKPDAATSIVMKKREEVYDGVIHKCPRCGNILKGFEIACGCCGYEIREEEIAQNVSELSKKINKINYVPRELSKFETFSSAFGLQENPNELARKRNLESKAEVITNYHIPNTKEGILEFMIMASANISKKTLDNNENVVRDAWISKMDQAYMKAQISFGDDLLFDEIERIYLAKKSEIMKDEDGIRKSKKEALIIFGVLMCGIFFLISVCAGFAIFDEIMNHRKIKVELDRLEELSKEIDDDIADGEYSSAMRKAKRLRYAGPDKKDYEEEWDDIREDYVEESEKLIDNES